MKFGKGYWKTIDDGIQREWLITNGIGGYGSSTIIGTNTRRHHGLFTASLHPPVKRKLILSSIEESLEVIDSRSVRAYSFAAKQKTSSHENGFIHLQRFEYKNLPKYTYQTEDIWIDKKLAFVHEKNTLVVGYHIVNGSSRIKFSLKPLVNIRTHEEEGKKEELKFDLLVDKTADSNSNLTEDIVTLIPNKDREITIKMKAEGSRVVLFDKPCYEEDIWYKWEEINGNPTSDVHFIPGSFEIYVEPFAEVKFSFICTIDEMPSKPGWELIEDEESRLEGLIKKAGYNDFLADTLVRAADTFITYRKSTGMKTIMAGYPWFTDWGRDTMIAFQGLALVTKRFDDAKEILYTFSLYVKNGLVPNMFPDQGLEPLYNTADASLWYFQAVYEYLKYTNDYDFIKKNIYPILKEIFEAYKKGTDFSIYMDEDGLIHAGSGLDQVTWMDVRINGIVVTPRHGKPVEINALWYNAIKVMELLGAKFGEEVGSYTVLSERVKESFNNKFWDEKDECLYDVIDKSPDSQIRPNQIWAISLPFTMLPREKEKLVVQKVIKELYASYGLRSLSQGDKEYKGVYEGQIFERDMAYHQGTVWSFPLGALVTAYCKVYKDNNNVYEFAKRLIEPIEDHLFDCSLGTISEIFDGNEPITPKGCFAQAWGVGEILRAYVEDILIPLQKSSN